MDHGGASLTFSKVQRAVQVLGSGSSLRLGHSCMIYKLIYYENNVYNIFIIQYYLVGGLEHEFYDFPYIGNNDPNWRTHIFQRGRSTTKQLYIIMVWFVFTHEFCLPRSTAFVQAIRLLDGAAFHLLEKKHSCYWKWPLSSLIYLWNIFFVLQQTVSLLEGRWLMRF